MSDFPNDDCFREVSLEAALARAKHECRYLTGGAELADCMSRVDLDDFVGWLCGAGYFSKDEREDVAPAIKAIMAAREHRAFEVAYDESTAFALEDAVMPLREECLKLKEELRSARADAWDEGFAAGTVARNADSENDLENPHRPRAGARVLDFPIAEPED